MTKMTLAAAINELRGQVEHAMYDAEDEKLQFNLGPIELELKIQLSEETAVKGSFTAWVINLGADDKVSESATHTIKLTLNPKHKDHQDLRVGARVPHDPTAGQR